MNAIILDTETTGLVDPEAVEIAYGYIEHTAGKITGFGDSQEWRFKPSKPISARAKATHLILERDLVDCPPSSTFQFPPDIDYLIGHNIDFDHKVVGEPNVKRICTLALSRCYYPEVDGHTLAAMMFHLYDEGQAKLWVEEAHGAHADIYMCWRLLVEIMKTTECDDLEELWVLSEDARIPRFIDFGKYAAPAGKPKTRYLDVPRDYLQWMLRQPDMDQYKIMAAKKALVGEA